MNMTATKERPILFRPQLVRAILEGRKTQTRRRLSKREYGWWAAQSWERDEDGWPMVDDEYGDFHRLPCHYGMPGDRLWVRETHQLHSQGEDTEPAVTYRADGVHEKKWRPSIFMPRWASRLLLEITKVRFEKLSAITEEDAKAEGIEPAAVPLVVELQPNASVELISRVVNPPVTLSYRTAFHNGFRKINKLKDGFDPWLWVLDFKVAQTSHSRQEER